MYKRQCDGVVLGGVESQAVIDNALNAHQLRAAPLAHRQHCLLYTSDAADERSSVDLGGRRIIQKKKNRKKKKNKNN